MHYRRLGRSGLKVSEISFGSWVTFGAQVDQSKAHNLIHAASDMGVNFFDTADVYANGEAEKLMGQAIRDLPRQTLVLSSKVFWPTMPGPNGRGLSRKHIFESVHNSLERLNTDYLDLYFCHRYDPDTPLEEVVYTMNLLIQQGKILYWGTSEWTPAQIARAHGIAQQHHLLPPATEQPQYNMFHRHRVEIGLLSLIKDLGFGLTTWSPLYFGILSGKYNQGIPKDSRASLNSMVWLQDHITPERIAMVQQLTDLAMNLGITTAQLALAWLLRLKEVSTVITGATRVEQLQENIVAGESVSLLDDTVLEQIEQILGNAPENDE